MTAQLIQPGDLNRRLVLEAPVETPDGTGGVIRSFAPIATVWAQLTPATARANVSADSLAAVATHRIVTRAGRSINTLNRFRDGARMFRIVSYRDTADRRFLEIDAEEEKD